MIYRKYLGRLRFELWSHLDFAFQRNKHRGFSYLHAGWVTIRW